MDDGSKNIHQVYQLTTMRWIEQVWSSISAMTIFNCWQQTGLFKESHMAPRTSGGKTMQSASTNDSENDDVITAGANVNLAPWRTQMNLRELHNPDAEDQCTEFEEESGKRIALLFPDIDSRQRGFCRGLNSLYDSSILRKRINAAIHRPVFSWECWNTRYQYSLF